MLAIVSPPTIVVRDFDAVEQLVQNRLKALTELETIIQEALVNRNGANITIPPALFSAFEWCITDICMELCHKHPKIHARKIARIMIKRALAKPGTSYRVIFGTNSTEVTRKAMHDLVQVSHSALIRIIRKEWPTRWLGPPNAKFSSFIDLFFTFQNQRASIWSLGPFVCWMTSQPNGALRRRMTEWLDKQTKQPEALRTKIHWLCAITGGYLPANSGFVRFWTAMESTAIALELQARINSMEQLCALLTYHKWHFKHKVIKGEDHMSVGKEKDDASQESFWMVEDHALMLSRNWQRLTMEVLDVFRERASKGTLHEMIKTP